MFVLCNCIGIGGDPEVYLALPGMAGSRGGGRGHGESPKALVEALYVGFVSFCDLFITGMVF